MATTLYPDYFETTLNGALTAPAALTSQTITVTTGSAVPVVASGEQVWAWLGNANVASSLEAVLITLHASGSTSVTVTRGADGRAPVTHSDGDGFYGPAILGDVFDELVKGASAVLSGIVRLTGVITPTALAANTDNWNPTGLSTANVIRAESSGASRNLTGIVAQESGRVLVVENIGSQNLVLKDADAASSAANRFDLVADVTLPPGAAALLKYDGTTQRWRSIGAGVTDHGALSGLSDDDHPQYATDTDLTNHTGDTTDAHAASAITNTPAGSIAATTVQAALNELDGDVTAHVGDTTAAHAATAISFSPAGSIAATTVQAAIEEVASEAAGGGAHDHSGDDLTPDNVSVNRRLLLEPYTAAQITGNVNDYDPSGSGQPHSAYHINSDASLNVTGLSVGQGNGDVVLLVNVGAQNIVLKHADTGSAAGNRFSFGGAADITMAAGDVVVLEFENTGNRWRGGKLLVSGSGGSFTGLTLAGDSGSSQAIADGNTITVSGGTGLASVAGATDTVTVNLDINSLTADASPDGAADYVATWDASASTHKKVLLDDLPGGGGTASVRQLNYVAAADLINGAGTATTWTDLTANQSFTVDVATSQIVISAAVGGQATYTGASWAGQLRLVLDSAGTPSYFYIGAFQALSGQSNALPGGGVWLVGALSAATHTIKVQYFVSHTVTMTVRASTQPNYEGLAIQVLEVKA